MINIFLLKPFSDVSFWKNSWNLVTVCNSTVMYPCLVYMLNTHTKKICLCLWKWKKQLNLYCLNSHVVIWLKILISDHANFEENNTKKFKVSTLNLMEKFGKVHKKSTIINHQKIDSDLITPWLKIFAGVLNRIWPTMKIHTDTDSTILNFSHFLLYALAHPKLINFGIENLYCQSQKWKSACLN